MQNCIFVHIPFVLYQKWTQKFVRRAPKLHLCSCFTMFSECPKLETSPNTWKKSLLPEIGSKTQSARWKPRSGEHVSLPPEEKCTFWTKNALNANRAGGHAWNPEKRSVWAKWTPTLPEGKTALSSQRASRRGAAMTEVWQPKLPQIILILFSYYLFIIYLFTYYLFIS